MKLRATLPEQTKLTNQQSIGAGLVFKVQDMNFREASIAIEVLKKYTCGETHQVTGEEITGRFEFEHDQCWVTLPRITDLPSLQPEEEKALLEARWFIDQEHECWSHF